MLGSGLLLGRGFPARCRLLGGLLLLGSGLGGSFLGASLGLGASASFLGTLGSSDALLDALVELVLLGTQLVLVLALPRKLGVRALLGLLVGRHGRSDVLLGSVGCRLGLLLALQEIFDGLLLTRDSISRLLLHVACLAECDLASLKLVQCLLSPGHEGIGPLNTCVHVA